jgi:hypothetical protein
VCTYGDEAGDAMENLSVIFPLKSTYSVAMPSNYVMGSDVESHDRIVSKITKAKEKL